VWFLSHTSSVILTCGLCDASHTLVPFSVSFHVLLSFHYIHLCARYSTTAPSFHVLFTPSLRTYSVSYVQNFINVSIYFNLSVTVTFRAMQGSVERIGSDCMIGLLSGLWTPSETPNRTQSFGNSIYFGLRLIVWWLTCVDGALYGTFRIRCAKLQDPNLRVILNVKCCIYICPIVILYVATSISIPVPCCHRNVSSTCILL